MTERESQPPAVLVSDDCHWRSIGHHGGFCVTPRFTSRAIEDSSLGSSASDQRRTPIAILVDKRAVPLGMALSGFLVYGEISVNESPFSLLVVPV